MNDIEVRLECLRVAVERAGVGQPAGDLARDFYAFVTHRPESPATDLRGTTSWRDRHPRTVAVTFGEGQHWCEFPLVNINSVEARVHAIKFADGSVWDPLNGWREPYRRADA